MHLVSCRLLRVKHYCNSIEYSKYRKKIFASVYFQAYHEQISNVYIFLATCECTMPPSQFKYADKECTYTTSAVMEGNLTQHSA